MMPSSLLCSYCKATNQPQDVFCHVCGNTLQANPAPSMFNARTGQLLPNILLKQRYRILHLIGQGGMGAVYQAEDIQLGNRKVALKEMRQNGLNPQEIADAAKAFEQEALMLAALQHPHLPNIYDHFNEAGRSYLVMSFIQGETLAAYLSKKNAGKLPVDEVLQIAMQLCNVLNYLHTQQPPIIFRDLKPANIMHTSDGHIYLIDFGIARLFKPGQTRDTNAYGSPGYAAPEQWGKATTPQTDIYSLGVVLHQLLSGHNPSTTPFRHPSLQSVRPALPAELIALIEQMVDMDESRRPASILSVKQKLQSIATRQLSSRASSISPTVPASSPPLLPTIPASPPPRSSQRYANQPGRVRQRNSPLVLYGRSSQRQLQRRVPGFLLAFPLGVLAGSLVYAMPAAVANSVNPLMIVIISIFVLVLLPVTAGFIAGKLASSIWAGTLTGVIWGLTINYSGIISTGVDSSGFITVIAPGMLLGSFGGWLGTFGRK